MTYPREQFNDYAKSLIQGPVVMFRQTCASWGNDILTATVQDPNDLSRFFVIGHFKNFPGWDDSSWPDDLNQAIADMEQWILEMNALAQTTQVPLPTVHTVQSRPVFNTSNEDQGQDWIVYRPESNTFTCPRHSSMHELPYIMAPDNVKEYFSQLRQRASLEEKYQALVAAEQKAYAAIARAQERYIQVQNERLELGRMLGYN